MNIAIVGTGYVGLVTGTCFSEMGVDVTCVDINEAKIKALQGGVMPIYEPGLENLVLKNVEAGRLHFTTDLTACLDNVSIVFSAVGTPPDEDGSADLNYVLVHIFAYQHQFSKQDYIPSSKHEDSKSLHFRQCSAFPYNSILPFHLLNMSRKSFHYV